MFMRIVRKLLSFIPRYRYSVGGGFRQNLRTREIQMDDYFYTGGWIPSEFPENEINWKETER